MRLGLRAKMRSTVIVAATVGAGSVAAFAAAAALGGPSYTGDTPPAASNESTFVTSKATNPFNFTGPTPGRRSELGVPRFGTPPSAVSVEQLKATEPRAGRLAGADALAFTAPSAVIVTNADGKFYSKTLYEAEGESAFLVESWIPEGAFTLRVPVNSPVTETKQTTISGHPALTQFPTRAVVGGRGPRDVFVEVDGAYHHVLAYWSTSDADVIAVVERMIAEVSK